MTLTIQSAFRGQRFYGNSTDEDIFGELYIGVTEATYRDRRNEIIFTILVVLASGTGYFL